MRPAAARKRRFPGPGGITLTGGGSLLHGLAELMNRETGTPVQVADGPFTCTAIGAARTLGTTNPRWAPDRRVIVTTAAVSN